MARFEDAIMYTIQNEVGPFMATGGYVNDPADPGGETKWGISKAAYPSVDIKNLTLQGAQSLYRRDFWHFDGIIDQRVATKLFDHYVNRRATIRQAQVAANVTPVDGIYGGNTEHAINAVEPNQFLQNFVNGLVKLYQDIAIANPKEEKFLGGWLVRARKLPQ